MSNEKKRLEIGEKAYSKSRNWEVEKIVAKYSEFLKLNNDL
jgi:hypothetical protein